MAVLLLIRAPWSRAGIRLGRSWILTKTDLHRSGTLNSGFEARAYSSRRFTGDTSNSIATGDKEKNDAFHHTTSDSSSLLPSWLDANFGDVETEEQNTDVIKSHSHSSDNIPQTDLENKEKTNGDLTYHDEYNLGAMPSEPSYLTLPSNLETGEQKPLVDHEVEEFEELDGFEDSHDPRPPRAVQAAYLRPLRRQPTHNIPVCDLQLRSYSVQNLEFMADFALRAAYFLDLPASGPIPLPQIVERWTVPKAHFIHKKIQENFERKTLRRLIQIKDGEPEVVRLWLGFIRKHAYYGVGMKANLWEFTGIDVTKDMDAALEQNRCEIEPLLAQYAFQNGSECGDKLIEVANHENRWQASGGSAPMINTPDWRKPLH